MTKAEQRHLIRALSASMLRGFLEKADRIPANWDGIEIRTWMAEEWQRESYARALKGNTQRGRKFRSAKYSANL